MSDHRPDADFFDIDVDAALAQNDIPGCSVAVLDAGDIVFERGYGTSRAGSGWPMTSATRMQACSMSKPVAVLAAMKLVEGGQLDLDADVSSYLTRWTLPANGNWRPQVTLRQLASHTAGLTAHAGFPGYSRGSALPSLEEILSGIHPANAAGARVDMLPDLQFRYSGAGTTILQLVMEEVTGRSAAELMQQLVLEPLGMHASTFVQQGDPDERAYGHLPGGHPVGGGWRVQPELCAAGLWTTPADYLRVLQAVQHSYAGKTDAFLTQSTARETLHPRAALPTSPDMIGASHIGLGFFVAAPDGAPACFGHTGSNVGFTCAAVASVNRQQGAVVMFNSDNGTPAARLLLQSIARTRQWRDIELGNSTPQERPRTIGQHAGVYRTVGGLDIVLSDEDGQVMLSTPHQSPVALNFDDSKILSTDDLDLRLLLNPDGTVDLEQGGRLNRLQRIDG